MSLSFPTIDSQDDIGLMRHLWNAKVVTSYMQPARARVFAVIAAANAIYETVLYWSLLMKQYISTCDILQVLQFPSFDRCPL